MYGGGPRGMGRRKRTTRKRDSPGILAYLNPRAVLPPSPCARAGGGGDRQYSSAELGWVPRIRRRFAVSLLI